MPTIKEYAKEAKTRMKSGFWDDVKTKRQSDVETAAIQGKNTDVVFCEYRRNSTIYSSCRKSSKK